jgi:hypothetical protein
MQHADPRVVKLVRQVDQQKQELVKERQKNSALRMQNKKLRIALQFEKGLRDRREAMEAEEVALQREREAKEAYAAQQRVA